MPTLAGTVARLEVAGTNVPVSAPLTGQSGSIRGALFTNGGSPVFNVLNLNGSVTPITLTAGPDGETWYDVELIFLHDGSGTFGSAKFGGCNAALTNGLDVKVKGTSLTYPLQSNSVADVWGTHTKNVDFAVWRIPLCAVLTTGQTITIGISDNISALTSGTNSLPVLRYRVHD